MMMTYISKGKFISYFNEIGMFHVLPQTLKITNSIRSLPQKFLKRNPLKKQNCLLAMTLLLVPYITFHQC